MAYSRFFVFMYPEKLPVAGTIGVRQERLLCQIKERNTTGFAEKKDGNKE